jgi:hypothetical protein
VYVIIRTFLTTVKPGALPHLAPVIEPAFFLAFLAVFCGVLLDEHR